MAGSDFHKEAFLEGLDADVLPDEAGFQLVLEISSVQPDAFRYRIWRRYRMGSVVPECGLHDLQQPGPWWESGVHVDPVHGHDWFYEYTVVYSTDRSAFYRERAAQTYNSLWYFVATTIVEIPYVFGQSLLFIVIFYPMVGFQGFATAVLYWIHVSLFVLGQMYFAQLLIHAFPSIEVAAVMGALINSIFLLFAGFNPPASTIPEGYKWLYTIVPQRFSISILSALVFCDCPEEPTWNESLSQYDNVGSNLGCQPLTGTPVTISHTTVKGYIESTFKYNYDDRWANFGYVFVTIIIFRILSMLSLRYINHTKR